MSNPPHISSTYWAHDLVVCRVVRQNPSIFADMAIFFRNISKFGGANYGFIESAETWN